VSQHISMCRSPYLCVCVYSCLSRSNTGFFPQTLATSPDIDFFTMADHAAANAYSNAVLDNFLDRFGPFDDFQV
jgi:hypothetical protein